MPVSPTYPGVYIEEIPSGVRTITGVATSITAFIGRTERGIENEPRTVTSFADFERQFGGIHVDYPLSYAVSDFYRNGGSQALIVRLSKTPAAKASISMTDLSLSLKAISTGEWGNNLYAAIDYDGITDEVVNRYGLAAVTDLFNLTVAEIINGVKINTEQFRNVVWSKTINSSRRLDRILASESNLIEITEDDLPTARPAESIVSTDAADQVITTSTGKKLKMTQATANSGKASGALVAGDYTGSASDKTGLYALEKADLFNLLCIPPDNREDDTDPTVYQAAMVYCAKRRALLLVDSPTGWAANKETAASEARDGLTDLGLNGTEARNAALYFPRVIQADPKRENQLDTFVPCGIIAGLMARTDVQRGVWKAPAGIDSSLNGTQGLQVSLTDDENGMLNPLGINCLRSFPVIGRIAWGSRTLRGADQLADEYKYIPVRRLALFIEESLFRGTQWVVFEPNDEPLWAQIRLNVGAFMNTLFRQGAFQGTTPRQAYFVKCDSETTTQNDIDRGIVNIVVGFAPLKPAEFVIIKLQQIAGELQV
jgi:phage tail sheath protein FI